MSKTGSSTRVRLLGIAAGAALIGAAAAIFWFAPRDSVVADQGEIPNFAPDTITSWFPDRSAGDDFLPPESGPGPVMPHKDYPYVPNNEGQPTYRVADLGNPILQPWVVES